MNKEELELLARTAWIAATREYFSDKELKRVKAAIRKAARYDPEELITAALFARDFIKNFCVVEAGSGEEKALRLLDNALAKEKR